MKKPSHKDAREAVVAAIVERDVSKEAIKSLVLKFGGTNGTSNSIPMTNLSGFISEVKQL